MHAPGEQMTLEGFRDIPKAQFPRVKKVNGRIAIFNGHERVGGQKILLGRIHEMSAEVRDAERGARGVAHHEHGSRAYAVSSSYPEWYSKLGLTNKDDFMRVVKAKQGVKFERVAANAAADLNKGYHTAYGDVPANSQWKVKTKQAWDNRGVVFRRVHGRIVPIHTKRAKAADEVPF